MVPAILANAGGVTVSYFEWVQNKTSTYWDIEQVDRELNRHMIMAARRTVLARQKYGVDLTRGVHRGPGAHRQGLLGPRDLPVIQGPPDTPQIAQCFQPPGLRRAALS